MLKSLPADLAGRIDSISLNFTMERSVATDLPAIENWYVSATAYDWERVDELGNAAEETVALINIVKGSLLDGSLWDQLDAIEADLEAVASSVLNPRRGDLLPEVLDRVEGSGSSLVILNSATLSTPWRGHGVGVWLAGEAIEVLANDAHCVVTHPAPLDGSRGKERKLAIRKLQRVWEQLGFTQFDDSVWILDPALIDLQNALERMRSNFGLR